jgi:tRNA G18 (ribose-2'-O)-methylase SpoU
VPISIENADDPRLAEFADLRRQRRDSESFVVESALAVERLLTSPYPIRSILVSTAGWERMEPLLGDVDAPIYVASIDMLRTIVGFDLHRGVLASAVRLPSTPLQEIVDLARRLVVLEGLNDLENLGSIARAARALGADAMLLDPTCADPLTRRAVRVSMGEILHLPLTRCAPWPEAITALREDGIEVWALTPGAGADDIRTLPVPERLALLAGAEGPGLTAGALDAATHRVRIPIRADVDSLNVTHAVAIALAQTATIGPGPTSIR